MQIQSLSTSSISMASSDHIERLSGGGGGGTGPWTAAGVSLGYVATLQDEAADEDVAERACSAAVAATTSG